MVGPYKNAGSELRAKGDPEDVTVHDFVDPDKGRAAPYGVYDLQENEAWVSVGLSHDTGEFAVNTIRTWWQEMGTPRYPKANSLLITADGGGSNGYRLRLWKVELQALANELGFPITVCHLPPGTSKWNKIETGYSRSSPRTGAAALRPSSHREPYLRHHNPDRPVVKSRIAEGIYPKGRHESPGEARTREHRTTLVPPSGTIPSIPHPQVD